MITNNDINKLKEVFATKDDLKAYATRDEVKAIVAEANDDQNAKIDAKLIQFRSDIFNKIDLVIGELKTIREEQAVVSYRLSDHEDRITKLESSLSPT